LWVAKGFDFNVFGLFDFVCGSVSDKDWLATPFDEHILALGNGRKVDFDFGLS